MVDNEEKPEKGKLINKLMTKAEKKKAKGGVNNPGSTAGTGYSGETGADTCTWTWTPFTG